MNLCYKQGNYKIKTIGKIMKNKTTSKTANFFTKKLTLWQKSGLKNKIRPVAIAAISAAILLTGCTTGGHIPNLDKDLNYKTQQYQKGDAAAKLASLSPKEIQNMDRHESVALLNAIIIAGNDFPEKSLAKFYRNLTLDPDYLNYYKSANQKWQNYAANSKLVRRTAKYWNRYDDDRRADLLQRILRKHSKILGFSSPTIFTYNEGGRPGCNSGDGKKIKVFTYAFERTGDLFFNTNKNVSWNNFEATLALAVHENTHAHQDQLVKLLRKGKITPSNPLWAQTALFALNSGTYINGCKDLKTYKAQPLERDAWQSQYNFIKARKPKTAPKP